MKVTCTQAELSRALSAVSRAVSTKTTLPVLQNILLATGTNEAGETRLKLAATNLEISVTTFCPATTETEGAVTIPARLLADFVNNIPKDALVTLTLSDDASLTLNIKAGRLEANIKGIAAEDFPELPNTATNINVLTMRAGVLRAAIGQTVFAASSDESRPVLTGVFASFEGGKVTLACADSFRLAVKTAPIDIPPDSNFNLLLPARAMQELSHVLASDPPESLVEISTTANKSQALFKTGAISFTSSLIEGNFPNYQQIIPKSYATRIVFATDQLLKGVKVASLFSMGDGNNIVRLAIEAGNDVTPGGLVMSANNNQVGDHRGEVDGVVSGPATEIALNAKFMQDVLGVVGTGWVAFELSGSSHPGVFKSVSSGDDYLYVIMPMHLAPR